MNQTVPAPEYTDFKRLMASVGYLIFCWSQLEAELAGDIRRLRSGSGDVQAPIRLRGSFSEQLAEWRALVDLKAPRNKELSEALFNLTNEIELLRQKRNLVAHNFAAAHARPEDGEPHIVCQQGERSGRTDIVITQTELSGFIEDIDRCRLTLRCMEVRYTNSPASVTMNSRQGS